MQAIVSAPPADPRRIEEPEVKKYLVLYHMPMSFMEMAKDADPAEMKAGMEAWMAWFGRCGRVSWTWERSSAADSG